MKLNDEEINLDTLFSYLIDEERRLTTEEKSAAYSAEINKIIINFHGKAKYCKYYKKPGHIIQ